MVGRNDTDPEVQLFVADGDLDPTVGGSTFFRDIDFGQDFDPSDDGRQHPPGGTFAFDALSIDAVPNPDTFLERFDVDVGGPQLDGFG